ncbi:MAG: hypothetical protein GX907_01850 [Clostridiaceae bacterium]|nr:hypothetical protein [Clostridiaceae bacterium]
MRYRLITPRVAGYVLPSLLFIPIAYGIRSLALGILPTIAIVIPACALLYALWLIITKDQFVARLFRRGHNNV